MTEETYIYRYNEIGDIKKANDEITRLLTESGCESSALYSVISNTDKWSGKSRDEFLAFYDLLYQLHSWVAGHPVANGSPCMPASGMRNSSQEMSDALFRLQVNLNHFVSDSPEYKALKEIWL